MSSLLAVLVASTITLAADPAADTKENIAVLTLKNASGVKAGEAEVISDRLRGEFFNTGKVNVMERDQMQEILKEQGFQQSGTCTDEACLVQMGQMLGVKKIATGSIGKLGSMFMVNMRMVDVQTGKITKVVSRDIQGDIEEVVGQLRGIANELVGAAPSAPAAKQPTPTPTPKPAEVTKKEPPEETPPPEPQATISTDPRKEKNKNRFGLHLGYRMFGGNHIEKEHYTYYDSYYSKIGSEVVRIADSSFLQPVNKHAFAGPELVAMIKAGPFLNIDVGGAYTRGETVYRRYYSLSGYTPYYNNDTLKTWDNNFHTIDFVAGLRFVKRLYPIKINVGVDANFSMFIMNQRVTLDETFYGYSLVDTNYAYVSFSVAPVLHAGVELMAGKHVGFNVDFLLQYLHFQTFPPDEIYQYDDYGTMTGYYEYSREITFAPIGIGMGVNFYF
jgi:TolB-like protein